MKRSIALGALTALLLPLAACTGPSGTTDTGTGAMTGSGDTATVGTIQIGFIGPLTGDAAAIGADLLNAMKWAVEEANADGGVNGLSVEIVAEDGRCTGSEAANAARKLTEVDRVPAILGGLCSGETMAAAPIVEGAKVVLLSPGSSNPDITTIGEFIFRNYPSDALKTTAMAQYFTDEGFTKVAMITDNADFSQGFRTALLPKVGSGVIVFDEVVEPGTKDFRSLLTRLKDVDFDIFFLNNNTDGELAVLLQQFREAGFEQVAITHDIGESNAVPQTAGDAAEGLRLINVPDVEDESFKQDFVDKYGEPKASVTWAAYAYDATHMLLRALEEGTTGEDIRAGLNGLGEYAGVTGSVSFDENGDITGIPYALKEFRDGKIIKVKDIPVD